MHHAAIVRRGEPGADLPRHLDRAILREAADAAKQQRQILAVDIFHRQESVPFVLADVEHATDVRVRHEARHAHLGVDLHQARGVAIDGVRQELQRHRLPQFQVVGAVDLSHPALAEAPDDAVAAVEEGARREPAMIDRIGAGQPAAGGDRFRRDVSRLVRIGRFCVIGH
jgi:hypothetical protein